MIGWGIIGCGMIAKFHARAIAEMRGSKLVACYSREMNKASDFCDTSFGHRVDMYPERSALGTGHCSGTGR